MFRINTRDPKIAAMLHYAQLEIDRDAGHLVLPEEFRHSVAELVKFGIEPDEAIQEVSVAVARLAAMRTRFPAHKIEVASLPLTESFRLQMVPHRLSSS